MWILWILWILIRNFTLPTFFALYHHAYDQVYYKNYNMVSIIKSKLKELTTFTENIKFEHNELKTLYYLDGL